MKNFQKVIFALILVVVIFELSVMNKDKTPIQNRHAVVTTTFALYDIAKNIVGESMEVIHLLPFGVSAHSFEPTPKLMVALEKSDLVVYSGAGLEPWTDGFTFSHSVINMSEHVHLRKMHKHEEEEHEGHHHHGVYDPHYWLDIDNMIIATQVITKELIKILPSKKEQYTNNMDHYIESLKELDSEYKSTLSECKNNMLITNHGAFGYLAQKYHFHVASLSGLSPETEPSAKSIKRIMHLTEEHNISTIFFENFVSDKTIKSIARDSGVKADVLQPLGNITADEAKQHLTYIDIMRNNLHKITRAFECH